MAGDAASHVVELLQGAVGVLPALGEEARLKGKYGASQAESLYGTASKSAEGYASQASRSVTSLSSQVSQAAVDVANMASSGWSVGAASLSSAYVPCLCTLT